MDSHFWELPLNRFCLAECVSLARGLALLLPTDPGATAWVERSFVAGSGDHALRPWWTWLLLRPAFCFWGPEKAPLPKREVSAESEELKIWPAVRWQQPWP